MKLTKILRTIWRYLPRPMRHAIRVKVIILLTPRPDPIKKAKPGPITVAGLFRSTVGLGHSARLCAFALKRLGYEVRYIDLSDKFSRSDLPESDLPGKPACPGEGGALIVHLNPPEQLLAYTIMGRRFIKHKRIIGYWHWELPSVPSSWRTNARFVHELWAPSRFTAEAIRKQVSIPLRIVPHPVTVPTNFRKKRRDFGFPEDSFVIVNMFGVSSVFERKNPVATVRSFKMAFGDSPDHILFLKVSDELHAPWAMRILREEAGGAANIRFMSAILSNEDIAALINCADVIISLHRSEGFGLLLAQGMLLGKSVIATGWSGNTDFMTKKNSALIGYKLIPVVDPQGIYKLKNVVWADPDIEQAAHWLQRLASDEALRQKIGRAAAEDADRHFSLTAYKHAIGESLQTE